MGTGRYPASRQRCWQAGGAARTRDDSVVADPVALDELRNIGLDAGLDALGVASAEPFLDAREHLEQRRAAGLHGGMQFTYRNPRRSTEPEATLPGARSLVVGARSYRRDAPGRIRGVGPLASVARYVWADDYGELRAGLDVVARHLRGCGWRAVVVVDQNHLVDRAAAHRAGLGWFGKNSNLLLPGRGSWFLLGSVITDAPFDESAETEPVPDGCGSCSRCIESCPTGAIISPGVVDARRCLAWSLQVTGPFPRDQRVALGDRIYGCDDCQEVCPPNRREDRTAIDRSTLEATAAWVPILEVLETCDEELMARFGHWYVPRREPRYLRRNALVALGNTADVDRPIDVQTCLTRYLSDPDPMLRAHAVWAARRLGWTDLLVCLADDPSADVQDELMASVTARRSP